MEYEPIAPDGEVLQRSIKGRLTVGANGFIGLHSNLIEETT